MSALFSNSNPEMTTFSYWPSSPENCLLPKEKYNAFDRNLLAIFQQFATYQNIAHPGRCATICLIAANFVWTGLSCNVHTWSSQCLPCQTSKTTRHISTPIAVFPFLMCHSPWWIMNINIFDMLPSCDSFHILLTTMDRSTRWPKAFPISDVSTAILVSAVGCHCLASLLF